MLVATHFLHPVHVYLHLVPSLAAFNCEIILLGYIVEGTCENILRHREQIGNRTIETSLKTSSDEGLL
jgi:hypothetical protein